MNAPVLTLLIHNPYAPSKFHEPCRVAALGVTPVGGIWLHSAMVTNPPETRGLERKLEVTEQALADLARREQLLAAKLKAASETATPRRDQESALARREADLDQRETELDRQEADLVRRQAELTLAEAELATARKTLAITQASISRAQGELDSGFARLSAAANELVRVRREQKAATADLEKHMAGLEHRAPATTL